MSRILKKAPYIKYADIKVGNIYEFERKITRKDLYDFAKISGNYNPLHYDKIDKNYGKNSKFGDIIVHGMLAGSLFSALIGMYCPGEKSLCLSQTLYFKKAVYPEDKVKVKGTVIAKNDSVRTIILKTEVLKDGAVLLSGEAKIFYLE